MLAECLNSLLTLAEVLAKAKGGLAPYQRELNEIIADYGNISCVSFRFYMKCAVFGA